MGSATSAGCAARLAARITLKMSCDCIAASCVTLVVSARGQRANRASRSGAIVDKPPQRSRRGSVQCRHRGAGGGWRAAIVQVNAKRKGVVVFLAYHVELVFPAKHLEAVARIERKRRIVVRYHVQVEQEAAVVRLRVWR